jgi:hypothetical protein
MQSDEHLVQDLDPITLAELNRTSELLDRSECKYALNRAQLPVILDALSSHFFVLEHVGRRVFRYQSVYFDENYTSYWHHFQGRRRRFKIRTRHYVDSGACTFEVKIKRYRGSTDKRRIPYSIKDADHVTPEAQRFIESFFKEAYEMDFVLQLQPMLTVTNDRITLVAKHGGERLTIDLNTTFGSRNTKHATPSEFVIMETKTRNGNGLCDKILRAHRVRRLRYCSKYCIGIAQSGMVHKTNTFRPMLRTMLRVAQMRTEPAAQHIYYQRPAEILVSTED